MILAAIDADNTLLHLELYCITYSLFIAIINSLLIIFYHLYLKKALITHRITFVKFFRAWIF